MHLHSPKLDHPETCSCTSVAWAMVSSRFLGIGPKRYRYCCMTCGCTTPRYKTAQEAADDFNARIVRKGKV